MLAVMYHYVRPPDDELPYLRHLELSEFRRQLDHLQVAHGFVGREEFLASFAPGGDVPEGCVLTFDDGLVDHARFVVPELVDRGLWGIFYVPAGPHLSGRMLDVHRVHRALGGQESPRRILALLLEAVGDDDLLTEDRNRITGVVYRGRDDDAATTEVRTLLNYLLRPERRSALLDRVEAALGFGGGDVDDWYASTAELASMAAAGMILGSHSVTHRPMAQLSPDQQRDEVRISFDWLESRFSLDHPRTFCYPYGGFHTFTQETEAMLDGEGVRWSFNVEPRLVDAHDLLDRPQALPRFDCCDLPHGRARAVPR